MKIPVFPWNKLDWIKLETTDVTGKVPIDTGNVNVVSGEDEDSEEESSDESDWEESDEESDSEAGGLDLDVCPPGCDQVHTVSLCSDANFKSVLTP